MGLAYLPDYYLKPALAAGTLTTVMSDWPTIDREIVVIYPHKQHLSTKVRLFTEFLIDYFAQEIRPLHLR